MSEDFKKFQSKEEQNQPSEYVRLEADLLSNTSKNEERTLEKRILIYSQSHTLLQEISSRLNSAFGSEVEVLSTLDRNVAIHFLESDK